MAYSKPVILAQNNDKGSYVFGCPGWDKERKTCER